MSLRQYTNKARTATNQIAEFSEGYLAYVLMMTTLLTEDAMSMFFGQGTARRHAERAQVDTIITLVVVAVVAIVGILIYSQVDSSITVTGDLSTSADNLTTGFGDAMELVPIVLIVLVAALVIGVIQRFRS